MAVKPIPEGYHTVIPYLLVDDAGRFVEFVKQAFDAKENFRMDGPDGKVAHGEVKIGDSIVMFADAMASGEMQAMPTMLHLFVEDSDTVFKQAVEAGATVVRDIATQFYGDRSGGVRDPFGNQWWISTHVEDVPPDEMERRSKEWAAQQGA